MNIKSYIAPTVLAVLTVIAGFYLLLVSSPASIRSHSEASALDAEVLRYFSVKADQYAKEDAEANSAQSVKKADRI